MITGRQIQELLHSQVRQLRMHYMVSQRCSQGLSLLGPSDALLINMSLVISLLVPVLFPTPLPELPEFISYIEYLYSNSYFRSPP